MPLLLPLHLSTTAITTTVVNLKHTLLYSTCAQAANNKKQKTKKTKQMEKKVLTKNKQEALHSCKPNNAKQCLEIISYAWVIKLIGQSNPDHCNTLLLAYDNWITGRQKNPKQQQNQKTKTNILHFIFF